MLKSRLALAAALLSVGGFVAWLSKSDADASAAAASSAPPPSASAPVPEDAGALGGSMAPCAVPLGWRIANIDPRFELDPALARATVERAAASWERAVGRPLFAHDPVNGFSIAFVYDERQAGAVERRRLERSMEVVDDRLRAERAALDDRARAYDVIRASYEGRLRAYERKATAHGDTVRGWNSTGGAPPALAPALEAAAETLDRERMELMREGDEIDATRRVLQVDVDELNRRLDERGARAAALENAFPPLRIESGLYRELIGREDGRAVALRRAIDVYRFESAEDLWLIVAHELGHALGLGHAASSGAVMSEEVRRTERPVDDIHPEDLELLKARCPGLVVSGSRRP